MKPLEIAFIIIVLIWILSMPFLNRFKIYQFCSLIALPFIISYVIFSTLLINEITFRSLGFSIMLVLGLIYQAWKFYRRYLISPK